MAETSSTASVLKQIAESIAIDIGQSPIRGAYAKKLSDATQKFVSLERTITNSSENLSKAEQTCNSLEAEFPEGDCPAEAGPSLSQKLTQCLELFVDSSRNENDRTG